MDGLVEKACSTARPTSVEAHSIAIAAIDEGKRGCGCQLVGRGENCSHVRVVEQSGTAGGSSLGLFRSELSW
jgi:hypothetical protein